MNTDLTTINSKQVFCVPAHNQLLLITMFNVNKNSMPHKHKTQLLHYNIGVILPNYDSPGFPFSNTNDGKHLYQHIHLYKYILARSTIKIIPLFTNKDIFNSTNNTTILLCNWNHVIQHLSTVDAPELFSFRVSTHRKAKIDH